MNIEAISRIDTGLEKINRHENITPIDRSHNDKVKRKNLVLNLH